MNRWALRVIGALWVVAGLFAFALPERFYVLTPGVVLLGPFNEHFVRDVGLAFLASGALTMVGSWRCDRSLAIAGTLWPCLHAAFHFQMWIHRGFPLDAVSAFDAAFVIAPAFTALALSWQLTTHTFSSPSESRT